MAGVIADEAKDIEKKGEPKPQRSAAQKIKPLPVPQVGSKPSSQAPYTTQASEPEVSDFKPQQPVPPQ